MEPRVKYPKTYHFHHSPNLQNDDRKLIDYSGFVGQKVVVTLKMDGENTTMYRDGLHARSLDSAHHPSRSVVKAIHGQIQHKIPSGMRICGENCYAEHSIHYNDLQGYFLVFGIWKADTCISWDETCAIAELDFNLPSVKEIYYGIFDLEAIDKAFQPYSTTHEGWVCRVAHSFDIKDFHRCVGKYVRKDHVRTDEHWMSRPVVPNTLAEQPHA